MGEYDCTAFGTQLKNSFTISNPFRYCGEYYDLSSGLIYLRNRYYDPSIGRFISEDPAKDGLNWYAYAGNNPVRFVDPSGEDAIVLTNEDAVYGFGHMGVLVQDCYGTWVYFSCGNGYVQWEAVYDFDNIPDLKTFSDKYYGGGTYTASTYIKGDFCDSCNYYFEYFNDNVDDNNPNYNVVFNNCSQVVMRGLNKGYLCDGTSVGEFTGYYGGAIPNSTMKFMRETFFNDAFNYSSYRKQLNDQIWEAAKGVWRSQYIVNRISKLDYFSL